MASEACRKKEWRFGFSTSYPACGGTFAAERGRVNATVKGLALLRRSRAGEVGVVDPLYLEHVVGTDGHAVAPGLTPGMIDHRRPAPQGALHRLPRRLGCRATRRFLASASRSSACGAITRSSAA